MTDMVERVGRAIAEAENYAYDPVPYDRYARAAIEAMREPTLAMRKVSTFEVAERDWPAMIDAALKP